MTREADPASRARRGVATPRIDALLVLMVVIWGVNYSVIKRAFDEIPPQPFNALRLVIASAVFLAAIRLARRRGRRRRVPAILYTPEALTRADRWRLLWLGLVGHTAYQICFVGGVAGTSVSNAALIIGATPALVVIVSAALGRERIGAHHWLGAAISAAGIYLVVGLGASFGGATWRGDVLVMISVACWAAYTLGAGRLFTRHSPLYVTGMSMAIGTVPYVALALPGLARLHWTGVSAWAWVALVLSALLALCVAYLIWYIAVQRIGASRTAMYSNLVPLVAMFVAAVWLGEALPASKIAGAAAVLGGVFLTRIGRVPVTMPPEE